MTVYSDWRAGFQFDPFVSPMFDALALDVDFESEVAKWPWLSEAEKAALRQVSGYVNSFLTRPHPDLGRKGAVCPYVRNALDRGGVQIAVGRMPTEAFGVLSTVMDAVRMAFIGQLEALDRENREKASVIIAVPEASPESIESVQKALKPSYIRDGLMIGEFYPGCPAPGLHNLDFRPLDAPVPCLAVRVITLFDAPFMLNDDGYIEGYLSIFKGEGRRRLRQLLAKPPASTSPDRVAHLIQRLG